MDPVEIKNASLKESLSDTYEALIMDDGEIVICDVYNEEIERFTSREEAEKKYLIF